jgi:hypothetical protein
MRIYLPVTPCAREALGVLLRIFWLLLKKVRHDHIRQDGNRVAGKAI